MITVDDIAGVVLARLAATDPGNTICPGGHWFDRGPDAPAGYPYDVFKIEARPPRMTTGAPYDGVFVVRIAGYCPLGDSGVNPQAVEQLFHNALLTLAACTAMLALSLRNVTERVLVGRPSTAKGEFDRTLRQGKDVFVAGITVELVVQGDRSVA